MDQLIWAPIAAAAIGLYVWYVVIVRRRNRVDEALAQVDVQLSQRHELIPNVLAVAKRYLVHEQALLSDISALRASGQARVGARTAEDIAEKFAAESQLSAGLGRLLAVVEAYPELKGDTVMAQAHASLEEVETNVAAARRYYNSAVNGLRNACQIFPGSLVARLAGVTRLPPFFEAPASHRGAVQAAELL